MPPAADFSAAATLLAAAAFEAAADAFDAI